MPPVAPFFLLGLAALGAVAMTRRRPARAGDVQLSRSFWASEWAVSDSFPHLTEIPSGSVLENVRRGALGALQPLRDSIGVPIRLTSGYRPPALNAAVGGVASSLHMTGEAADITADGWTDEELIRRVWELVQAGAMTGVGEVISYEHTSHLHIDWAGGPADFMVAYKDGPKTKYRRWHP